MCFSHSLSIHQFNSITQCKILASEKNEYFLDLLCGCLLNFSVFPPNQREQISQKTYKSIFVSPIAKFWPQKKLKISWISFVNIFSTSQFCHLAREKISQKTHKSNIFYTNCKNIASEKIEDFLDLVRECLLNFSVFRLKIALQRAFLGRAILIFTKNFASDFFFEDYLDLVSLLNFLNRDDIAHKNYSFLIINQLLIINDYIFPHLTRENGNREEIAGKTDKSNTWHQNALGKFTKGREAAKYYFAIFFCYAPQKIILPQKN